jgi:hypothetical protein
MYGAAKRLTLLCDGLPYEPNKQARKHKYEDFYTLSMPEKKGQVKLPAPIIIDKRMAHVRYV